MTGYQFHKAAVGTFAVALLAAAASAQAPAAPAAPAGGPAVAAPTYISIPLEIAVNRPAADVWKRVGKFCDIGEWLRIPCTITSGKDGEFGAVRSVAGEVLVGKTELSYTYTQTVQERPAVQPLSRHARGEAGDGDDLEDRLHPDVRQLDAGRRCRPRSGQGATGHAVHDGAREHEDPRRRRHAAAGPAAWRRTSAGRPLTKNLGGELHL